MVSRFGGRDVLSQDASVRSEPAQWARWLTFWTVLGLAFATQVFLAGRRFGQPSDTWGQAIRMSLPDWYVWGLFALLIARLKQRVPIDAMSWGYNFAFHVAASLLVGLAHFAISVPLQTLLQVVAGEPRQISTYFLNNFATVYLWNVVVYWSILAGVHARDYRRDLREHRVRAAELEARLQELHATASVAEEPSARRHPERLLVAENGRSFFVRTADVDWIEAARNYVRLHVGDRVHTVRTTIATLEARLDPERFRRMSRSALVNLDRVREVQPWFHGDAVVILERGVGVACAFAGLCYAEMASAVPVAGSAYTYAYATMGEFAAWIIGWDLVLEYAAGAATVGVGWSGHFVSLLGLFGIRIPASLTAPPTQLCTLAQVTAHAVGCAHPGLNLTGAIINLPAVGIVALMSAVLVIGIKESARVNSLIVILKVGIVLLVVLVGLPHVRPANWTPFIPPNTGEWGTYGWSGVLRGAGLVFFSYIGFDTVSTAAQESKNPQRDMPIGLLGSLAICTLLYVVVSAVLVGMVPYGELNLPAPMAYAMERIGAPWWIRLAINLGAVLGVGSVILVMLLGQSRVFYSMSRDGLLGPWAGRVHPRLRTPYLSTIYTGIAVCFATGLLPLQLLGTWVNIGTLLAFVLVCAGVWILRRTRPDLERPVRTPLVPLVPLLGILSCLGLMLTLPLDTWIRLAVWLVLGFVVFLGFRRKHSALRG